VDQRLEARFQATRYGKVLEKLPAYQAAIATLFVFFCPLLAVVVTTECTAEHVETCSTNTELALASLLTQRLRVLKNFPTVHGDGRFITVSTRASHWSLFSARYIQYMPSHANFVAPF
jgi:hypothetical protein